MRHILSGGQRRICSPYELDNVRPIIQRARQPLDAGEFFQVFSRFEYALKRAGYLRAGRDAEPIVRWPRFARAMERRYETDDHSENFRSHAQYLLDEPPQRQIVQDGQLAWKPLSFEPNDSDVWRLIIAIRAVRNNLLHGERFTDDGDPERDQVLISTSLFVIDAFLDWEPVVLDHFARHD